jgi:hypothetical protein
MRRGELDLFCAEEYIAIPVRALTDNPAVHESHMSVKSLYTANPDARAALTYLECGACTDWTV